MIDATAPLWCSSQSEGVCVDACQSTQNLPGPGKASAVKEGDVIAPEMTHRRISADVAYITSQIEPDVPAHRAGVVSLTLESADAWNTKMHLSKPGVCDPKLGQHSRPGCWPFFGPSL
jgi:hypothetical protein